MFRASSHEHKTTAITTPAIIIIIICRHNTKFLTHKSAFGARFLSLAFFFHISVENERWAAADQRAKRLLYIHIYMNTLAHNRSTKPKPIASNERREEKKRGKKKNSFESLETRRIATTKKEKRAFLLLQSNARQWVAVHSIMRMAHLRSRRCAAPLNHERVNACVCVCLSTSQSQPKPGDPIVWTGWTRDGMEAIHSKYILIFFVFFFFFYFSNKIWIQNLRCIYKFCFWSTSFSVSLRVWNCRKAIYVEKKKENVFETNERKTYLWRYVFRRLLRKRRSKIYIFFLFRLVVSSVRLSCLPFWSPLTLSTQHAASSLRLVPDNELTIFFLSFTSSVERIELISNMIFE